MVGEYSNPLWITRFERSCRLLQTNEWRMGIFAGWGVNASPASKRAKANGPRARLSWFTGC